MLRVRMSAKDAHYGGNLVDGAHMVHLFGDVATELLIKQDGDEGLFCAYDMVEFKAPVYAGDYIEAYGEITHVGNTSRKMKFEAYKVIRTLPEISASAAEVLEERILVARATGTCVTPKETTSKNRTFHLIFLLESPAACGRGFFLSLCHSPPPPPDRGIIGTQYGISYIVFILFTYCSHIVLISII